MNSNYYLGCENYGCAAVTLFAQPERFNSTLPTPFSAATENQYVYKNT
jgi:hypothetical protein